MAATGLFDLILRGKGTHAAYPHLGDDLVLAAAQITNALQALASRFNDPVEPVVVSVTSIQAGEAYNVLPDSAKLIGTVRALSTEGARAARSTTAADGGSGGERFRDQGGGAVLRLLSPPP